ncbi:sialin [Neodiprion virginianus]|uniref:sialin n=1 Tax=Neodiprion virginianus TaxID=2961670 RepID=UPI001EE722C7|nr:sialin [Neodiprion virginianus]XP_046615492.1 sialin [Neodiprion virginianus]XP_046615494.1 sialin [Neodiprion virginianus]XP_046615495.1 sialin [Neodiprion virginianus]XP_046615496.1 sialin [Neodiprion virginianus]XP_046615497.1 sialin [Neodiprion virginianus]
MDGKIDGREPRDTEYGTVQYEETEPPSWMFWKKRRYVLAILAFFGFFTSYILRVNLSIAIVAMTANNTKIDDDGNTYYEQEFNWDSKLQGLILSSFFYGYITTQLFGGLLASKIGGKRVFGGGIAVTALLTVITPPLVRVNVYILVALRIIEGVFEGVTYPCIHAIWAKWAPPLERSKLGTLAFSGSFIGTVVAMPVSGIMADRLGWASIFYSFGAFGIIWYIVWTIFVTDDPEDDPYISKAELRHIKGSLKQVDNEKVVHPWKDIVTSMPVWAIVAAHFSENWGFYTMLTQLPTFLSDTLDYKLEKSGFVSALPYLAMAIMLQAGGYVADYLREHKILTTTQVRKTFNCLGFVSQTIFMMCAAFIMTPVSVILCITIAIGLGGLSWVGFSVNHLDIAPQHASVLMGFGNTIATVPGIVSPIITGYIVQNKSAAEWRIVFIIAATIYIAGAVIYGIFASGEVQPWAMKSKNRNETGYDNPALEVETFTK